MASSDLNQLFNEALGFAEYMLLTHGEFIPFGVSMDTTGKIAQVAGDLGVENPASTEMVDFLQSAFRESAATGSIRAAGVCVDPEAPKNLTRFASDWRTPPESL